jgi:hypothetical protein
MCRVRRWVFVFLVAVCGTAYGAGGKVSQEVSQWDAVRDLQPDVLIAVLPEHQAGTDLCRVVSVDDTALTCLPEARVRPERLVFARSALSKVWVIEAAPDRHVGRWIRNALEVGLVVAACVAGDGLGGLLVGGFVIGLEVRAADYPSPRRRPRIHRRLIYSVT